MPVSEGLAAPAVAPLPADDSDPWALRVVDELGHHDCGLDLAVLVGPPGSGRSRALTSLAERLRAAGARVVVGIPRDAQTPDTHGRRPVVVADDVHAWPVASIARLRSALDDGHLAVLAATENRLRDTMITGLIQRSRPGGGVRVCTPVSTAWVLDRALLRRVDLDPTQASHIRRTCAGAPGLIDEILVTLASEFGAAHPDSPPLNPVERAAVLARKAYRRRLEHLDDAVLGALAVAVEGNGLDTSVVAEALDIDEQSAITAVDRARGSGLLLSSDTLVPTARGPLVETLGPGRVAQVRRASVVRRMGVGSISPGDAMAAAELGIREPRVSAALLEAAARASASEAEVLLTAAAGAGGDASEIAMRRAHLALAAGDVHRASRIVDEIIGAATSPAATHVAPTILAARIALAAGRPSHAADLIRWLGPKYAATQPITAVRALLDVGDRDAAAHYLTDTGAAPTAARTAQRDALRALFGEPISGPTLDGLLRALPMLTDRDDIAWPALMLAVQSGDVLAARVVADEVFDADRRDLALRWIALLLDPHTAAGAPTLTPVTPTPADRVRAEVAALGPLPTPGGCGQVLRAAAAVEFGLADTLTLGELWLSLAAAGEQARVRGQVAAFDEVVAGIGTMSGWAVTWNWYAIRACAAAGDRTGTEDRLARLETALSANPGDERTATLAAAARVVHDLAFAATPIDDPRVVQARTGLVAIGAPTDAARLCADTAAPDLPSPRPTSAEAPSPQLTPPSGPLTDREAQVAHELLAGCTYAEIGARLFISAKTVEHHVARIRRRFGGGSRSEVLAALRAAGYR
ncbi:helix-turn-helix domain-containing protein [Gordonia polyisoprenivorans]|uniref:helix-turn-helix domain-containing protein n=1 Tax=Gordonia polyisoprenivorans TaxID=84595 RepID=UPI001AD6AEB0|nr:helix-turn-helix transcriptional regulator [Gordonia polyisoprenivorans]QTI70051.1 helix-turn-helix transcriptional regulator [Gordonia polyisoprenivorans]